MDELTVMEKAAAIREWMKAKLDFQVGDVVTLWSAVGYMAKRSDWKSFQLRKVGE